MKLDLNKLNHRRSVKCHMRDLVISDLRSYVIGKLVSVDIIHSGMYSMTDVKDYINGCHYELLHSYIDDANILGWESILTMIYESLQHAHEIHIDKLE